MLTGVGACLELALDCGLAQHHRIGNHGAYGIDALVQVNLDGIEIAVVSSGDLFGDIALGDAVYIASREIQRSNHRIQSFVNALHDFAVVALMLTGVGACLELAFDCGLA